MLRKITDSLSNPLSYSVSIAIEKATGISGHQLYDDWILSIKDEYSNFGNKIKAMDQSGEIIEGDLTKIANKEKILPANYLSKCGFRINDEGTQYLRPLIQGEAFPRFKDGLPIYDQLDLYLR